MYFGLGPFNLTMHIKTHRNTDTCIYSRNTQPQQMIKLNLYVLIGTQLSDTNLSKLLQVNLFIRNHSKKMMSMAHLNTLSNRIISKYLIRAFKTFSNIAKEKHFFFHYNTNFNFYIIFGICSEN